MGPGLRNEYEVEVQGQTFEEALVDAHFIASVMSVPTEVVNLETDYED
jgi:hypothetical protein